MYRQLFNVKTTHCTTFKRFVLNCSIVKAIKCSFGIVFMMKFIRHEGSEQWTWHTACLSSIFVIICFYVLCFYVFLLYFVYDFIINKNFIRSPHCYGKSHAIKRTRSWWRRFKGGSQRWWIIWKERLTKKDYTVWTLEERRNKQDLIEVFNRCNGLSRLKLDELFTVNVKVRGTRGYSRKLAKFWCTRDCCKYLFLR